MRNIIHIFMAITVSVASITIPFATLAQTVANNPAASSSASQFRSDGIFGCNQTGAAASSVGTISASGTYVPVADAAVILNTGYLVYLACSLRPLVSALSQNATAGLVKKILVSFNSGNDGGPQFSQNIDNETTDVANKRFVKIIQGGVLNTINPAIKGIVQTAVVRAYSASVQQPNAVLRCPYAGNLQALLKGTEFSWDGLDALQNPACHPLGAYQLASELTGSDVANAVQNYMTQLQWGQGIIPRTAVDENGDTNVVTPGAIVLNQAQQALQSGLLKTENAQDIGQMVNALFAGIGAQAVSGAQGLAGISQSQGGQPSYLDRVTAAASAGVRSAAVNTAITILNSVRTTVTNYRNALVTIANTLIQTIHSLQDAENQCWANIIQNVCAPNTLALANGVQTCKDTAGNTLKIATSTAFSNAVVQSQIAPLGNTTGPNIKSAQDAMKAINQLIAGVTNTTSQDAQSLALQQLDQLTASNSFPKQSDIQNAQQQASSVGTAMQILVNQTVQNWQGIDSNGAQTLRWTVLLPPNGVDSGWCNYNNQPTLLEWAALWKV